MGPENNSLQGEFLGRKIFLEFRSFIVPVNISAEIFPAQLSKKRFADIFLFPTRASISL